MREVKQYITLRQNPRSAKLPGAALPCDHARLRPWASDTSCGIFFLSEHSVILGLCLHIITNLIIKLFNTEKSSVKLYYASLLGVFSRLLNNLRLSVVLSDKRGWDDSLKTLPRILYARRYYFEQQYICLLKWAFQSFNFVTNLNVC